MKFYQELANWWTLISPQQDYEEEAAYFLTVLSSATAHPSATLLELGSGGGHNAYHIKHKFASVTLVDLFPEMLESSRQLNPDCEHLEGDMRTLRMDRTYDAVFIHDAIDYMTTLDDLRQAVETAFIHCKPGGMVLLVPDHVRETFEPTTDHGGEDGDGRAVRYLEWSYDPDPTDTTTTTDYVFVLRHEDGSMSIEHDRHILGLFARDEWLAILEKAGFRAEYVIDDYERYLFIGRKP